HGWRDDPLMQLEFLDGGDTDRPPRGGSTGLSVTDSSQGRTAVTGADALSCTMSREIAKAMAVSTVSTILTARTAQSLLSGARVSISPIASPASCKQACPGTRRLSRTTLATQIVIDEIEQRHAAPACASRVRTTYAHRTRFRTRHAQALGRQRS